MPTRPEKTLDETIDEMEDVVESLRLELIESEGLLFGLKMKRLFIDPSLPDHEPIPRPE